MGSTKEDRGLRLLIILKTRQDSSLNTTMQYILVTLALMGFGAQAYSVDHDDTDLSDVQADPRLFFVNFTLSLLIVAVDMVRVMVKTIRIIRAIQGLPTM